MSNIKKGATTPQADKQRQINQFFEELFETWGAEDVKENLWLLFIAAIGSNDSQAWPPIMRANMASLYKRFSNLIDIANA